MKYAGIQNFLGRGLQLVTGIFYSLDEVIDACKKFEKNYRELHVEEMQKFAEWINAKDIHLDAEKGKNNNPAMEDWEVISTKDLYDEYYAETHKPDPNQTKVDL